MQQIKVINEKPTINLIMVILLTCISTSILLASFVLCADIYGAGPPFVAVTTGLGFCAFSGYLWYARKNEIRQYNLTFGVCVVLTVLALQNAVLFGGLSLPLFAAKMFELTNRSFYNETLITTRPTTCNIPNSTNGYYNCASAFITDMDTEAIDLPQQYDAEVAMCFFCTVLFLVMIPFTLAQYASKDSQPAGGQQDHLDYSSSDFVQDASASSTAEYTDL